MKTQKIQIQWQKGVGSLIASLFLATQIFPQGSVAFATEPVMGPCGTLTSEIAFDPNFSNLTTSSTSPATPTSTEWLANDSPLSAPSTTIPENAVRIGVEVTGYVTGVVLPEYYIADQGGKKVFYILNKETNEVKGYTLNISVSQSDTFSSAHVNQDGSATFLTSLRYVVVDLSTGNEVRTPPALGEFDRARTTDGAYTVIFYARSSFSVDPNNNGHRYFFAIYSLDGTFQGLGTYLREYVSTSPDLYEAQSYQYDSANGTLTARFSQAQWTLSVQRTPEAPLTDPYIQVTIDRTDPTRDILVMTTSDNWISGTRVRRYNFARDTIQSVQIVAGSVVVDLIDHVEVIPNIEYNSTGTRLWLQGDQVVSVAEYLASVQGNHPIGYFVVQTRSSDSTYTYLIHASSQQIVNVSVTENAPSAPTPSSRVQELLTLYQEELGREPSESELASWAAKSDLALDQIRKALRESNEGYVVSLYRILSNRTPSVQERTPWVDAFNRRGTRAQPFRLGLTHWSRSWDFRDGLKRLRQDRLKRFRSLRRAPRYGFSPQRLWKVFSLPDFEKVNAWESRRKGSGRV